MAEDFLAVRAFKFTEARVEEAINAVRRAADGPGDCRRQWRDEGCRHGLYLRAGRTGGTYYRIHKQAGRKVKVRLGDATAMKLSEARNRALKHAGGNTDAAAPVRVRTDGPTVQAAWDAYMAAAASGLFVMGRRPAKASTLARYEQSYGPHVKPRYGRSSLHRLAKDIRKIHASLIDRPCTANNLLCGLKAMFTHAATVGTWTGPNPLIDQATGRQLRRHYIASRTRYLSNPELKRVMKAAAAEVDPWPDFFPLLLLTGVRQGSLKVARWAEFDLEAAEPTWLLPTSKTGHPLLLPLMPAAVEILRRRQATAATEFVFPMKSDPSRPIENTDLAWFRIREVAGVPDCRLHDFRRTNATIATIGGATLQSVGRNLGHRSLATTQRVYAIADLENAKQAASIVEQQYREATA